VEYDSQNPFARILRGDLPSIRVYEDELTVAIMDIMPQADGHVLILPKEAAVEIFDLSEESAVACIRTTQIIAKAVKAALNPPGVLIAQVNGSAAGQTVPHVHFHVIPRREGETLRPHGAVPAAPRKASRNRRADRCRASTQHRISVGRANAQEHSGRTMQLAAWPRTRAGVARDHTWRRSSAGGTFIRCRYLATVRRATSTP